MKERIEKLAEKILSEHSAEVIDTLTVGYLRSEYKNMHGDDPSDFSLYALVDLLTKGEPSE